MSYFAVARLIARQVILHEFRTKRRCNSPNEWLINPALQRHRYYLFFVPAHGVSSLGTLYFIYFETHKMRTLRSRVNFNLLLFHSICELPRKYISSSESSNICSSLPFSLPSLCASHCLYAIILSVLHSGASGRNASQLCGAIGLKFLPATMRCNRASTIVLACSHSCSTLHACLNAGVIQVALPRQTRRSRVLVHVKFARNNSELESRQSEVVEVTDCFARSSRIGA